MAAENQQTMLKEITSETPSEREVFAGDEDFYRQMADSNQPAAGKRRQTGDVRSRRILPSIDLKSFSTAQKVITVAIVAIAVILLFAQLKSPPSPRKRYGPTTAPADWTAQQAATSETADEDAEQQTLQQIQKSQSRLPSTQSLSLRDAENLYLQEDYANAYTSYKQLHQSLPANPQTELIRDFLQLKMALCIKKAVPSMPKDQSRNATDQAGNLLKTSLKSRSPVVRVVAGYHLILADMEKKEYLKALTGAYQTIALIGAVDFPKDVASSLESDCHFLAAESLTRNVLSLCDADKELPADLWSGGSNFDPFINLNEEQIQRLLNSGLEQLNKALLSPQIRKLDCQGATCRWSVTCCDASAEELLARFAANAGLDINWGFDREPHLRAENPLGKKPVTLYMPAVTTQQFITAAAGCAGMLALQQDSGTINISDPAALSSLPDYVDILSRQAITLWQRFLLTFYEDKRTANAHFAIGLLQTQKGRVAEAIAEYKLVANQFSQTKLAPYALLHSGKLKAGLNDYYNASRDLRQLVEQYPDAKITSRSYLHLADATMKALLFDEAGQLYRKIYNLDISAESRTVSSFGAAKCSYETKDYENAAKWLTRYIDIAKDNPGSELYSAYLLQGKTSLALKKPQDACTAFQYALGNPRLLTKKEYVETVSALVKTHIEQEQFVEALDVLENVQTRAFSQQESIEMLLQKCKIFRAMGLVDKATSIIGDQTEYIAEPVLMAKVSFELANCQIARGDLESARKNLTEILTFVEPGPLAHETALKLADVCLRLEEYPQTISICSQLLELNPSEEIRQKALENLAAAHKYQKDYNQAALALLGQWNEVKTP